MTTAIRLLLASCFASVLLFSAAPAAQAESDGVPLISGEWTGKVSSVYWDQTSGGAVHPKQKYKSKVDATIAQNGTGEIVITLSFDRIFPVDTAGGTSTLMLSGNVGNYHASGVSESGPGIPAVTVSGTTNKKGTSLTLKGVAASDEFTQEIKIKLKRTAPAP